MPAHRKAPHYIGRLRAGREEENGHGGIVAPNVLGQRKAIEVGHHYVGHDQIGALCPKQGQPLPAIGRVAHPKAAAFQAFLHNQPEGRFVFYKQNNGHAGAG